MTKFSYYTNVSNEGLSSVCTNLFTNLYNNCKDYSYIKLNFMYLNSVGGLEARLQSYTNAGAIALNTTRFFSIVPGVNGSIKTVTCMSLSYEYPTSTTEAYSFYVSSNNNVTFTNTTNYVFQSRLQHNITYQILRY